MQEVRQLVDGAMVQACSGLGAQDFRERGRMRLYPVHKSHDHDKVKFHAEIFHLLHHGAMSLSYERTEALGIMIGQNS